MKKIKKIALPLLLTLGGVAIPILVGSVLISNSNTTSNKTTSLISDRKIVRELPTVGADGIITSGFVVELITYKKTLPVAWDKTLIAADFTGATSVADGAFQNNTEIISIILSTEVISIGANAFSGAANLTTISALGATSIGANAFAGTTGIVPSGIILKYSFNIKPSNAGIWGTQDGKIVFEGTLPTKPIIPEDGIIDSTFVIELFNYKHYLEPTGANWIGPFIESDFTGATSVGVGAFRGRSSITSISLPDSVLTIGANAFNRATSLTNIDLPGATSIGRNAFKTTRAIVSGGIKLKYNPDSIKPGDAVNWGTTTDNLLILNAPIKPIMTAGIINNVYVNELILYKNSLLPSGAVWNGILVAADFTGATSVDVNAFQDNTKVTSIILPKEVISIGENAFSGATNLTSILAIGATSIGANAFVGTTGIVLGGIKLKISENINDANVADWGTKIEYIEFIAPTQPIIADDGIITSEFVNELITYKKSLLATDIVWNGVLVANDFEGATSVAASAFQGEIEIISIILPIEVISIGENAFSEATSLTTIDLLGATSIGANAFAGTTGIAPGGIKLEYNPDGIKPGDAVNWGTTIEDLSIANAPTHPIMNTGIIDNVYVDQLIDYKNSLLQSGNDWTDTLVETDFDGATSVADNAFLQNFVITSIILPGKVTSIGANAFAGANLTNISAIGATSIGNDTFSGATSLTTINLPAARSIGSSAFSGATSLTTIDLLGATSIGELAFAGTTSTINLTWSANVNKEKIADWGPSTSRFIFASEPIPPTVGGIIDARLVNDLITYKEQIASETSTNWDGILVAADFDTATSVAIGAFKEITATSVNKIKTIELPLSVLDIGANAFEGVTTLTTISMFGAKSIGNNAFAGTTAKINLTYSTNIKPSNAEIWGTTIDKLSIVGVSPSKPTMTDGIIDKVYVDQLIAYKNYLLSTGTTWDGILVAADFDTATSVAIGAFKGITAESVNKIKTIELPLSVLDIGANAFEGITTLTTISALGATSIGNGAFAGTTSIINLRWSTNINYAQAKNWGTTRGKLIFGDTIPNMPTVSSDGVITKSFVTELIEYKEATSPTVSWNGILVAADFIDASTIEADAFLDNKKVTSIALPTAVISIGTNAFNGATNLTTISALGVKSIGNNAFAGTTSTINLTYGPNINYTQAENWGTTRDKLIFTDTIPDMPTVSSNGVITKSFVTELIKYKEGTLQIGVWNGVLAADNFVGATSVAIDAFQDNTKVTSITLPPAVTSIGANAFRRATNLTAISGLDNVLSIGANAFNGASALTAISALGATSIGNNAFEGTISIKPNGIKLTNSSGVNISKAADWGIENTDILNFIGDFVVVEGGLSSGAIIGMSAAIGGVALIALLAGGFIFYRKKYKS